MRIKGRHCAELLGLVCDKRKAWYSICMLANLRHIEQHSKGCKPYH